MKSKIVKGVALVIITGFMISCNSKKEESPSSVAVVDKEEIKTEIQAIENAFVKAYNDRNVDEVTFYADDAVSFLQGGSPLEGKAAIIESLKKDMESAPKGDKFSFTTKEVFPSNDGNQVVEVGSFVLTDSTNTMVDNGHYISVFEKRNGKYVCIRDMGASDKAKKGE